MVAGLFTNYKNALTMKIISEISLENFKFWSGAKDTAESLTSEQFDRVEKMLEEQYPDGIDETTLNDIFWFDSQWVYEAAGGFPKYYKFISKCGRAMYGKADNADDALIAENCGMKYEEVDEDDCGCNDVEDVNDIDFSDFNHTHYFSITSRYLKNKMIIFCRGDDAADELQGQFYMCGVEEINEVDEDGFNNEEAWDDWDGDLNSTEIFAYDESEMWDSYDIPVYAIPRICQLILDPNNSLDYYEIPESHAINEYNRNLELNDEDIKNIDKFVAELHKAMPDGFTIDWDVESVGSPYFDPHPAFGLAMDCVKLRVYPNETDTRGNN